MKPRIRWNALQREYVCSDRTEVFAYAWGSTPQQAYERWLRKFRLAVEHMALEAWR